MNALNLLDSDYFEIEKTLNTDGWKKILEIYRFYAENRITDSISPSINGNREHAAGQAFAYRDCMILPDYELNKWRKGGTKK